MRFSHMWKIEQFAMELVLIQSVGVILVDALGLRGHGGGLVGRRRLQSVHTSEDRAEERDGSTGTRSHT